MSDSTADTKPDYLQEGDGYTDITLKRPLEINGIRVGHLRMREPTLEDQLAQDLIKGSDAIREITTMASLCDVAPTDIRKLSLRDYRRVQAAFMGFID